MARPLSPRFRRTQGHKPPMGLALDYADTIRRWLVQVQDLILVNVLDGWEKNPIPFSAHVPRADASDYVTQSLGPVELALEERLSPAKLTPAIEKFAKRVDEHGKKEFRRVIGISHASIGVTGDTQAVGQVLSFRDRNVGLIKSLVGKQLLDIKTILAQAEAGAWRVEELRAEIQKSFSVSKAKADLLARDQVLKLNGQITQTRQTAVGIVSYIWTTSRDERVRPVHKGLDGTIQTWANPPQVSDDGRRGHPGDDYQCRCTAFPILPELDEKPADQ